MGTDMYQLKGDFEAGEITDLFKFSGNTDTVTSSELARCGTRSARLVLERETSALNYRSELVARERGNLHWGRQYWLGFSFYLKDWANDAEKEMNFQLHGVPSDWNTCKAGKNAAQIYTKAGLIHFAATTRLLNPTTGGATPPSVWSEPVRSNHWYDWVIQIRISPGDDGFIRAWRDNEQIFDHQGVTTDVLDCCGVPKPERHYLKIGIYKPVWKTTATDVPRREMYYDEVRIGCVEDGYTGGYEGVAPGCGR